MSDSSLIPAEVIERAAAILTETNWCAEDSTERRFYFISEKEARQVAEEAIRAADEARGLRVEVSTFNGENRSGGVYGQPCYRLLTDWRSVDAS